MQYDILDKMEEMTLNAETKDSVFVTLFKMKKNVYRLYRELHPEDTEVTIEDIKISTLTAVFVNYLYNDLGFIVNKHGVPHLILLVEAQSRWNNNMTMRVFIYLAETYHRYLKYTNQNLNQTARVKVPAPELYLVYSGDDRKNVQDTLNIRDELFGGEGTVDLTVKVLHVPNRTLLGQYIAFCKIFNGEYKLYGRNIKTIEETIRMCLEQDILAEFINKYKQEVMAMLSEFFNEKTQIEEYNNYIAEKSRAEGRAEGKAEGRAEGEAIGLKKGRAEGKAEGEVSAFAGLVRDGILTLAEAAKRANMTAPDFAAKAGLSV